MRFPAQAGDTEHFAHLFKCDFRIFILDPHSLCRIDGRTAAHSHDPVRFKLCHGLCALHHRLYGRIRLNAFKQLHLHACFFQILFCPVQKSEPLHRASAHTDHCFPALKGLQRLQCSLSVIQITG